MKTLISVATILVVMFTFGQAYAIADQMPLFVTPGSAVAPVAHNTTDWSSGIPAAKDPRFSRSDDDVISALNTKNDIGSIIYANAFENSDAAMADRGVKGSAAGGLKKEDENTRIWDYLLGTPGGSDLP
jgi:hypothetical protein